MQDSAAVEVYLQGVNAAVGRWGPPAVFVAMLLECFPVAGFVVPGLTVLVGAGFLAAGQDATTTLLLYFAAFAGALLADNLGYAAGRASHRLAPVRRLVERHARLRAEVEGQPWPLLVFYQFPPYSRMFAPLLLGALALPLRRWGGLVAGGTLLFVTAFFGLGYLTGRAGQAVSGAHEVAGAASALFVIALLVWGARMAWRLWRSREGKGTINRCATP